MKPEDMLARVCDEREQLRAEVERLRALQDIQSDAVAVALERGAATESERDALRAELAQLASNYATAAAVHIVDQRELAAANAEVERLRAENEGLHTGAVSALKERNAALDTLAAANALLDAIRKEAASVNGTYRRPHQFAQAVAGAFDRIRDHLAAQPTTAPTLNGVNFTSLVKHRTEAEQRVLDAMADVPENKLAHDVPFALCGAALAELARRGLE